MLQTEEQGMRWKRTSSKRKRGQDVNECNKKAQPVIVARDGLYVSKVWYLSFSPAGDWLACARQDDEGGWILIYRFRYYRDERTDSKSKDVKNFYVAQIKDEAQAVDAGNKMASIIQGQYPNCTVEEIIIKSDNMDKVMAAMERQPWTHKAEVIK
jgi:hypothetical protein